MLTYKPDNPRRAWAMGSRFRVAPPEPVRAEVKKGYGGNMAEFWDDPVPLMTQRLYAALVKSGVSNVDTYAAEIFDPHTSETHRNYVAFNIIGAVAAADLNNSVFDASSPERIISVDFDSVAISGEAARAALLFRLAESVNAIVVHERVKAALESEGIDTLTFIRPEEWAG